MSSVAHASGKTPRFAILASGRGSNAEALMQAFTSGFIPAELALVLSDKPEALVINKARQRGWPTECIPRGQRPREAHERDLLERLAAARVDHVLLAGYMRLLSPYFLAQFPGQILNIHPALLPDFPGLHAVRRQWQAGRKVVGATVHCVDTGVDSGTIVLQGSLLARGDESAQELAHRILHEVEQFIYPRPVRLFVERLQHTETLAEPHSVSAAVQKNTPAAIPCRSEEHHVDSGDESLR